jgi:hypothetical protein
MLATPFFRIFINGRNIEHFIFGFGGNALWLPFRLQLSAQREILTKSQAWRLV